MIRQTQAARETAHNGIVSKFGHNPVIIMCGVVALVIWTVVAISKCDS